MNEHKKRTDGSHLAGLQQLRKVDPDDVMPKRPVTGVAEPAPALVSEPTEWCTVAGEPLKAIIRPTGIICKRPV